MLDIYLSGDFSQDVLYDRKERYERTIHEIEAEQKSVNAQMELTITYEQLTELKIFAANIADGLSVADGEFETRRRIMEYLQVIVEFKFEDGVEIAQVSCEFGLNRRIPFSDVPISTDRNFSHQPELRLSASSQKGGAGNCRPDYKHITDTVLSSWQTEFTLAARLVRGQDSDGNALAQALFNRFADSEVVSER